MSENGQIAASAVPASRRLAVLLPLFGFLALAALLFVRLGSGDPSILPSALIDKPVPAFMLPPLRSGEDGLASADLARGVHLVNIWGSWCGPCRQEHPLLMRLARDKRFTLVGINWKDVPENATRFLGVLGDPFSRIGADLKGATAIDWGVYGAPETFLVKDGIILRKYVGALTEGSVAKDLMPAVERALTNG